VQRPLAYPQRDPIDSFEAAEVFGQIVGFENSLGSQVALHKQVPVTLQVTGTWLDLATLRAAVRVVAGEHARRRCLFGTELLDELEELEVGIGHVGQLDQIHGL